MRDAVGRGCGRLGREPEEPGTCPAKTMYSNRLQVVAQIYFLLLRR